VVMEWMAIITGDHVGYLVFQDLGNFSQRRKKFGEQKFAHFSVSNFAIVLLTNCLLWYGPLQLSKGLSLLTNLAAVYYDVMPGLV
jgi:hypothetical protein